MKSLSLFVALVVVAFVGGCSVCSVQSPPRERESERERDMRRGTYAHPTQRHNEFKLNPRLFELLSHALTLHCLLRCFDCDGRRRQRRRVVGATVAVVLVVVYTQHCRMCPGITRYIAQSIASLTHTAL